MTRAPMFALRALWAHGGAAQAFIARDQRVAEQLARVARDAVPELVLRDGDALRTLVTEFSFAQRLRRDGSSDDADMISGVGGEEHGDAMHGARMRRRGANESGGASSVEPAGNGHENHGVRDMRSRVDHIAHLTAHRAPKGKHAQPLREATDGMAQRAGPLTKADVADTNTAAQLPSRPADVGESPGRRNDASSLAARATGPRPGGHQRHVAAADAPWREVAPLRPTLLEDSRRRVAALLAGSPAASLSPPHASRGEQSGVPLQNRETIESDGGELSSLLARVLETLERQRAARVVVPTPPSGNRSDGRRSANAQLRRTDASDDAIVERGTGDVPIGTTGFRALAARAEHVDEVQVQRAPFLQRAVPRRPSPLERSQHERDVHHALVTAARAEGLDLEEVTS